MDDVLLNFTVPGAMVTLALKGFLARYPNDEKTDVPDDETPEALYTDGEWVREKIKRIIIRDIQRGLEIARDKEVAEVEDTTGVIT